MLTGVASCLASASAQDYLVSIMPFITDANGDFRVMEAVTFVFEAMCNCGWLGSV